MSCVELKLWLGVDSACIVKNSTRCFPKQWLTRIMEARHGAESGRRGNWVVMSTEVAGVKLLAIAYAWSSRGTSFFITTFGSTEEGDTMYTSNFEDEYGAVGCVEIPRPSICSFVYEMLPVIDEHNRQRQHFLDMAGTWPTKDCWFRILGEMVSAFH